MATRVIVAVIVVMGVLALELERRDRPVVHLAQLVGVVHVRAPAEVLASVLALRLHLDDTPSENGALRVVLRSHLSGRLSRSEISQLVEFLHALTDPASIDLRNDVPEFVPSGLPLAE